MLILTVSDIFERVYLQLRENNADPVHWDDAELFKYLHDMLVDVAEKAQCFKISKGIEIKQYQRRYRVPPEILVPTRIEWDGEFLDPCSVEDLDEADLDWRSRSGEPAVWFVDIAPAGYVDLHKSPDTDGDAVTLSQDEGVVTDISKTGDTYTFSQDYGVVTGWSCSDPMYEMGQDYGIVTGYFSDDGNLMIHGFGYPDPIENYNDTLPRPIHSTHQIAVDYLTWRCLMKDGPGQDVETAKVFRASYLEQLNNARVKPRTSARRRFVRRQQDFELVTKLGPRVPSIIS